MLDYLAQNSVLIVGVLGALAFMVSLVTELFKDLPYISEVPTKAVVMTISMIITVLSLVIYTSYTNAKFLWYYLVLSVFASFVVSYISMYGWDTLKELWNRFQQ